MFEQGPVVPSMTDYIVLPDETTGIQFHVKETMTKIVLDTITAQDNGVDSRLTTVPASLIESIVRKEVSLRQTIAQATEAVVNNPGFIS